jgi:spermidine/putrescine transport system ATP-binding protein
MWDVGRGEGRHLPRFPSSHPTPGVPLPVTSPLVELRGVTKRFGDFVAVDDVALAIAGGEFLTLLGASGSGKTTTLRMIAGFEQPTAGEIWMDGQPIHALPPYKRHVNTVFQNYALFPHMSVRDNIGYGLRMRGVAKAEIVERVDAALAMVHLEALESRAPRQLSGGQQQRVALARALVNRPKVLLLDEPLGALDLKLRKEMQLELKHLQTQVGITFLYVTHDQEEALTMSDRIALMRAGKIEQLGTPREIYERPATRYAADFIGETNLLPARVRAAAPGRLTLDLEGQTLEVPAPAGAVAPGQEVWLSVRPEVMTMVDAAPPPGHNSLEGTVEEGIYAGSLTRLRLRLPGGGAVVLHLAPTGTARAAGARARVAWPADRGVCLVA